MCKVGQLISENWKNAIVPRSPIAQPTKHQSVLTLAFFQVGTQSNFTVVCKSMLAIGLNPHQYALNTLTLNLGLFTQDSIDLFPVKRTSQFSY